MLDLFIRMFKVSIAGFGGGNVMTALYMKEFVDTGIIPSDIFMQIMVLSKVTPGPISASIGGYIGYYLYGLLGVIIANIGMVLPTVVLILLFSDFLKKNKGNEFIENIFKILRPITVALIVSVFFFFLKGSVLNNAEISNISDIFSNFNLGAMIILVISFISITKYKLNPIQVIVMCAVLGAIIV